MRSSPCLATLPSAVPNTVLPVLHSHQQLDENSPLGDLLGGVLDVPSCQIGECQGGMEDWGVLQPCRVMFAGLLGQRASVSVCRKAPLVPAASQHQSMVCACHGVTCSAASPGTEDASGLGLRHSLQPEYSRGVPRVMPGSCSIMP